MAFNAGIKPVEACPRKLAKIPPEEEIVISGIAGRFPESNNVNELHENLINKKDLVTSDDRRWKIDHPEIPQRVGKINNIEKFDALFFGVHFKQAHTMDPMCRILLEHAYEAIIDAGMNPKMLRNTRTGVFIGACFSESEKTWFYEKFQVNGFGITGCARAMLSNRISYWLGLTGPSYTVDTACSSSLYAMEHAYRAIREGHCDAAIVGGANLCLHPFVSMQFFKLGVLSTDGRCKTFDETANGYVRSEAVSVVFLQKAKDAKRVYATFVHGKTNCDGFKEQGITFPSSHMQSILLDEFYQECGVPRSKVSYVEAHGTGTRVGDPEEIKAIDKVLGKDRTKKNPLLVGSVKTNLGHSEPASGLVSITKVLLAMENGVIPPQINYTRAREEINDILDERIKIVTEPTPWKGGYAGVNSFGFGGANCHILLKSNPKEKVNNGAPQDDLPRLVLVSGRSDEAVDHVLKDLESRQADVEYIRLLHDIHSDDINAHLSRGYTILPPRGVAETPMREIKPASGARRPVWFVFAGMGSQWAGMGEALLRIPTFAASIKKCDAVLKPHGIDIHHVITNREKTAFDNILNSFVGIGAIQIALVDVLKSVGIEPDNIIGHSVGELGCAYADGCFTAEQMILAAYSRGMASIEAKVVHGSMAAVGLGYKDVKNLCPPDIEVACHNSAESSTISGPAESMKAFVAQLQAKNIFAREVPCSNIPYHSRYIAPAGAKLLESLKKIVPDPKPRSAKWLSTSVPIDKWGTPEANYSSAEYHTNNLLNAVLFEETSALIPKDAICIEIAPHSLLQAILRRSLPPSVANIPLTQRGHRDNVEVLLQAFGKMFNVGLQPQLANLYPPVEYPVSRSTRIISPLIKWQHSEDWYVTSFKSHQKITSGERIVKVSLSDTEYEFLAGHVVDGRNLYPATGYLQLIWETLGMMHGEFFAELSVVFENVKFIRATNIPKDKEIELTVMIQKGTGRFEIVEGGAAVVTGHVRVTKNPAAEKIKVRIPVSREEEILSMRDVYKEMKLRGYQHHGLFRGIVSATRDGSKGQISWQSNWVAFMDNMLQIQILGMDTRGLFVPTSIKKMTIDTGEHLSHLEFGTMDKEFPVYYSKLHEVIVSGGIEIRGLKASAIARKKPAGDPVLEEYKFVPFVDRAEVSLREISRLSTHIGFENHQGIKVKTIEFIDETDQVPTDKLLSPWFSESLGDLPLIQADIGIVRAKHKTKDDTLPANVQLVDPKKLTADGTSLLAVGHRLLSNDRAENLRLLLAEVKQGGFVLSRENVDGTKNVEQAAQAKGLRVILEKKSGKELFVLLRKQVKPRERDVVIKVDNDKFDWVDKMRETMSAELEKETATNTKIIFVGQGDFENGLMGLINCLKQEPGGEIVRGILIQDPKAPEFSVRNSLYAKQLEKDLAVCVLRENGVWGSYRHLPLPPLEAKPTQHIWLNQTVRGDLSSLKWFEGPIRPEDKNKDLVHIFYSAINFKDVMLATGKLAAELAAKTRQTQECILGFEYSGIDAGGKRIMGLLPSRCMANLVLADRYLSWQIPDKWSLEEAATVPAIYGTCLYALYTKGGMKKGDTILIHAGTGGIGQAAIYLALHEGCEIFTTVGTPEKRQFISKHFPQIPEDHIGNSRDTSFEQMVMDKTKGRGVDIILNSLAEEKLLASVACLAWGGRFLEIGKFDLSADNPLGMECFLKEVSFQGVMLDRVFDAPDEDKVFLTDLMNEKLKKGAIKPLVRTVFPKEEAEEAFRYMAAGKHIGKVLIKIRDEKETIDKLSPAIPRFYCPPNRSYVILGGLGGFGLELADWLVLRGAKYLVMTSRVGIRNGYQKLRIDLWKSYGVNVVVIAGKEASNRKDCQAILETAAKIAPVDGVFNLAVVLKDALWDNQTPESFEESFRSKAWATKHLDVLTRKVCPVLRHFVVFSSVSCGRGNAGQSNYGMSNSVMERICERRANEGLPGLAVQWGAVGDVGLVADMQEDNKELVIGGTLQQRITSCLQELEGFLQQKRPVVSSMVVAEKKTGGEGALSLVDTVLNIMGLKDLKGVSLNTSLAELGMDSMMSVEIKQTLEREFEIFLAAQDIRGLNFTKLQEMSEVEEKAAETVADKIVTENGDSDILTGMRLVLKVIGNNINQNSEPCLKLCTREEQGRIESFLIPGVESVGQVFIPLAPKLRSPTNCLQLGVSDHRHKTAFEMADYFLPYVLEKSKDSKFLITGYSFGSLIAIELVRKLEAKGLTGQLILIDGAPYQLKAIQVHQMKGTTKADLENLALSEIMHVTSPTASSQLTVGLEKCSTWEDKLQLFTKLCPPEQLDVTEQFQKDFCTAIYVRVAAIIEYDVSKLAPIKSPITLLKPTAPTIRLDLEDYGLSKITSGKVSIHYIPGNHVTMLDNDNVAYVINGEPIEDPRSFKAELGK
ncbi:fatty acid synthase [Nasonia vitripennis]|uniref:Fatty acid synthase n=1 Tax=Nasonia vitripennis TaxID=7425 RepID=A0A7M7G637_NASVI|nr:fatty acid synthase [Nasonia vitripennis]